MTFVAATANKKPGRRMTFGRRENPQVSRDERGESASNATLALNCKGGENFALFADQMARKFAFAHKGEWDSGRKSQQFPRSEQSIVCQRLAELGLASGVQRRHRQAHLARI